MRPSLIRAVDLMAAVPGIVFGLWVLLFIQPHATHVAHFLSKYFGWIPFFKVHTDVDYPIWNQAPGYAAYQGSAFIAAIAVAMMIIPMATSVMREVFSEAPAGEKEAAIALGATRWAMVRTVVIPFGRSGIIGGTMLALGRALGETISVVLIISQAFEIKPNVLESGTSTISAMIAIGYKEATPSQLSALLTAGFLLFLITLVVNTLAARVVGPRAQRGRDRAVTAVAERAVPVEAARGRAPHPSPSTAHAPSAGGPARTCSPWSARGLASVATTWLLYTQLLPLSGKIGFVVCWFAVFVPTTPGSPP